MATTTVAFDKVAILIGDGAQPTEAFAQACLVNSTRGIQFQCTFSDDEVPDCDNPTNPAQILRHAQSISMSINGAGKVHQDDVKAYIDWVFSGAAKNAKIQIGSADATGAAEITCALKCSDFSVNTQRPATAEADVSFVSHGLQATDVAAFTS